MFLPFLQYYFNKGKVAVMIDNERLDNLTEIFEPKNYMMTIVVGKGIAAILTIKDLDTNKDMTILCGTMYNLRESFKIASKIFNRDGVDIKLLTDFNTLAERLGDKMKEKLISLSCQHREDMLKESFFLDGLGMDDTFLDASSIKKVIAYKNCKKTLKSENETNRNK